MLGQVEALACVVHLSKGGLTEDAAMEGEDIIFFLMISKCIMGLVKPLCFLAALAVRHDV